MASDQYIPLPPRPILPELRAKPLLLSGAQNVLGGGYRPAQVRPRPYNPSPGPPTPVPPRGGFGGSGPFIPPETGPRTRPLQFLNPGAGFSEQDVIDAIAAKMGY